MSSTRSNSNSGRQLLALPLACALALPFALAPRTAFAQGEGSKDCAPGSWFCGDTAPPSAGANKDLQPLPDGAVVVKPAPITPLSAMMLADVLGIEQPVPDVRLD